MSQVFPFPLASTASMSTIVEALNDAMAALKSNFSGGTAPDDPVAGQIWFNSDTGVTYQRNTANTAWTTIIAIAEGGATSVVRELDNSGFDGIETSFADLLPVAPETSMNVVVLIQAGVGPLRMVGSSPGADEFSISGLTNQDVEFGTAPSSGDRIYAVYVAA